ncbi:MAG TPA: ATP-binding protein [Candidatus Obscuribacter sp.]|nr:ATP-binding protein [Candidatus Obscuribacter sp.]
MQLSLTTRTTAIIAVVAFVLIYIGTTTLSLSADRLQNSYLVSKQFQLLDLLDSVVIELARAEAGEREYLITGDNAAKERYQMALSQIDIDISKLRLLLSDRSSYVMLLEDLTESLSFRKSCAEEVMAVRDASGLAAAKQRSIMFDEEGMTQHVEWLAKDVSRTINHEMTERFSDLDRESLNSMAGISVILCSALLALVVLIFGVNRYVQDRLSAESTLKEAQRALMEREARMRAIVGTAPDGIVTVTVDGEVESANAVFEEMFGYEAGSLSGVSVESILPGFMVRDDLKDAEEVALPDTVSVKAKEDATGVNTASIKVKEGETGVNTASIKVKEGETGVNTAPSLSQDAGRNSPKAKEGVHRSIYGAVRELTGVRRDGSRLPVELSVSAVELGAQSVLIGIVRDITERRVVEERVKDFYSMVSHELRTPLASIRTALGLLENSFAEQLNDESRPVVKIAADEADRLMRLINDILDMRKIESGKIELYSDVYSAADLVARAVEGVVALASEQGITFEVAVEPHLEIYCDFDRAMQVLTNVLSNAIKYSPAAGKILVSAETMGNFCRFAVQDQGPGVPKNQTHKLFGRFEQLRSSDGQFRSGSGLGLAIAKAIVEGQGGQIGVELPDGGGSCFWFTLPLPSDDNEDEEDEFDEVDEAVEEVDGGISEVVDAGAKVDGAINEVADAGAKVDGAINEAVEAGDEVDLVDGQKI